MLVGRPNVGKSTLFNRITDTRRAIVTAIAGTTRDVIAQPAEWQGTPFTLVDTGGMFGASEDPLHELVVEQGAGRSKTADVIVFVVDGREGLVPGDEEIAAALRAATAPVIVAVNKTDDKRARGRAVEFYQLGFEPVVEIAAEHGDGRRRPARRDHRAHCPRAVTAAVAGGPGGNRGRHRRPAERRQVVAGQPAAAGGAVDRQRDAGDDARHGRRGAEVAQADLPDRRHRRASGGRAGWRGRARSRRSA